MMQATSARQETRGRATLPKLMSPSTAASTACIHMFGHKKHLSHGIVNTVVFTNCRTQQGDNGEEQPEFLPMFPWYSGKFGKFLSLNFIPTRYPCIVPGVSKHLKVQSKVQVQCIAQQDHLGVLYYMIDCVGFMKT